VTARIEVAIQHEVEDPRGAAAARQAREFLGLPVSTVRTRTVYKLALELAADEQDRLLRAITDPVLEESAERLPLAPDVDWVVAVGFKPGVTDNVGRTARVFVADVLGRELPPEARVFTETVYLVSGQGLERDHLQRLAGELLANELIHRVKIWRAGDYASGPLDLELPLAAGGGRAAAEAIPLPDSDEDLLALSQARTLSLSLAELHAIRAHFADPGLRARRAELGLPADAPTDVELEALAQTWSEHCKHKIFNARIRYSEPGAPDEVIHSLFRSQIVQVTREIGERVDWLVSVFDDNAGVVRFDAETNLVYKVETHNSPSALDPYGGAITGIVGVNRDPMGTGLGAALLTNVWGYCLASPFHNPAGVPEGLLHPRRIRDGVHQGVIDGGNQSGIPYSRGFELFDRRYLGKPLVFCGTVGWLPARVDGRPSHAKQVEPGDLVVMVGGRIGADGIHGATFSSEALHGQSPAQAVQIGDPITQKKMSDMLLEARDAGLYRVITDNGAGGLSSSVGEMAQLSGGAELDLERAPLKYPGLMPWEILLSEAQERMTLAVSPDKLEALLDLARRREVEATVVGRFTASGTFQLRYEGQVVGELEMAFLHDGCPTMELEAAWAPPVHLEPQQVGIDLATLDAGELLGDLLASLNLCSKEARWRQYDHEVKGLSVVKPLVGVHGDVPSDCTAMRVTHGRPGAVLLAEGIAPRLSDLDTAAMAAWVVDLATRRIVAGGGRLGRIAGLDNFCWPDPVQSAATPDGRYKLAQLVRACKGLATMTRGLDLPCISGKDSMKNDSVRGGVKISIPPTLLFSALGWIEDARRAMDLVVGPGELIYLLGETRAELGGSELFALLARRENEERLLGNQPPRIAPEECRAVCSVLEAATEKNLVSAAHAPGAGGLALALARLCLASNQDLGLEVDLDAVPRDAGATEVEALFAESGSRLLVAVPVERREAFEALLAARPAEIRPAWACIGQVSARPALRVTSSKGGGRVVVDASVEELRRRFKETLDEL
jgi:phosphoribosylformylglycinamidine synthase II